MSAIRGAGFAVGAAYSYGWTFGVVFGGLSTVGQVAAYRVGIRPTIDYNPATRPRLTIRQFWAALNRTVGYTASGYLAALAARHADALSVGVRVGLATGLVTVAVNTCTPFIEWTADHVPEKRMGVFGVGIILVGFALQSVQYWVAFLDVKVGG
jgi:hypothetical protein